MTEPAAHVEIRERMQREQRTFASPREAVRLIRECERLSEELARVTAELDFALDHNIKLGIEIKQLQANLDAALDVVEAARALSGGGLRSTFGQWRALLDALASFDAACGVDHG